MREKRENLELKKSKIYYELAFDLKREWTVLKE